MSKVYIVNNTYHDYTKAEQYGTLVDVTKDKVPIFSTSVMNAILKQSLEEFTEVDFLLLDGPAILCVMASTILFSKFDTVKFLVFDAKQQKYVVRHLNKY